MSSGCFTRLPLTTVSALLLAIGVFTVAPVASKPPAASVTRGELRWLGRVTFGIDTATVARYRLLGREKYLDEQLHPPRTPSQALDAAIAALPVTQQTAQARLAANRLEQQRINTLPNEDDKQAARNALNQAANQAIYETAKRQLMRALDSPSQLREQMTWFWMNHFSVFSGKANVRWTVAEYEEQVRAHALGRFSDLVMATATSPAMLEYLDNAQSAVGRINENYARELMELHTLGVDGGYTQKDVTEVARCFTGWTIDKPRAGGSFIFRPALHDLGPKVVLGHAIKAGGDQSDGERVLDILAKHPSTARFIASKLVRRFVSDTPPQALVDRATKRFRDTDGDLREVMRTILTSPEFLSPDAVNAKMKTPFEFVASALRATGADVQDALPLVRTMQQLGMPLYQCQPPTGYKDTADAWVNTGALVDRMNFAVRLSSRRLPGVTAVASGEAPDDLALKLGGPDFQRR